MNDRSSMRRVVADCNVLFQALISPQGPSGAVLDAAKSHRIELYTSDYVVFELSNVVKRPHLIARFGLTESRMATFYEAFEATARLVTDVPHVFVYLRDPKDAHYVDLAIAADAHLIVSRDADLLSLGEPTTPEGRDFAIRFPTLRILTPPQLLLELEG